jgi:trans-aconitate 2-methyltransferase
VTEVDAGARSAWDAGQYLRYADHRGRPFADLVARVRVSEPRLVVDLGCGPGNLTVGLAERWPAARVIGVDSSQEMVAAAAERLGRLGEGLEGAVEFVEFVQADLRTWTPPGPVDVVLSNAALHWVPRHRELFERFAGWLADGGAFAFQVPANFDAPSHLEIRSLCSDERWRDRLGGAMADERHVAEPAVYLDVLASLGLDADVWEATYLHVLSGDDPVLEWVKGTALRPVLSRLDDAEQAEFCAQLGARLRAAYPAAPYGTVLPFRRVFGVGHRVTADAGEQSAAVE